MQRPALYYPYIHIRDEQWLKTAALYWPSIYRLVPDGYFRSDGRTSAAFCDADILRTVDPGAFTAGMEGELARALRRHSEDLVREFSIERALADFDGVPFGDLGPDVPALGWIHIAKFPERLLAQLCDMGLAQQGRAMLPETPHRGAVMAEWIGLHPTLAGAYMTVVARRVGQDAGYNPLTDQADLRRATVNGNVAAALRLLGVGGDSEDAKEAPCLEGNGVHTYVSLALNYVRPGNLDDVAPEAILRCRTDLEEELQAFREYVAGQQQELSTLAGIGYDRQRLEAFTEHVTQTIEVPLKKLERGLALHRMEPTRSLLLAGSFTPPAAVAAFTDNVPVAATTVGVAATVGSAWWSVSAARRSARQASPVGYLLDVRDRLTPQTVASRARALYRGYR
ncbi:hypothetical protein [Micromonospora aurantiaca (nom. illeg.)]|uniref:hypothetical protein n=1 Tax=Micromonospora aurantiaca (nom. illeg.) TaxID=47850 RepID=UPI00378FC080